MDAIALVLDPSSPERTRLKEILQGTDLFSIILAASTPEKALAILDDEDVDLVLLGWRAETEGSGNALLERMRRRESWSDLPVAALTDPFARRLEAYEAGVGEIFDPCTPPAEVTARLRLLLQRKARFDRLRRDKEHLARLALTDALTGLYNRAYFEASLEIEIARSLRAGHPCSLLLLDIDHFKAVNDTWGHGAGDKVLEAVAASLKEGVRRADVLCRFGGEEFAVILPGTAAPAAFILAERLRTRISRIAVGPALAGGRLSASIGISNLGDRTEVHPRELIEEADCALYRGKRRGRNRTELFSGSASSGGDFAALADIPCGWA